MVVSVNVYSALQCLHHVDMGSVFNILEVHTASIFKVRVCRVGHFVCVCVYRFIFRRKVGGVPQHSQ
jgi:hypothetical protein